MQLQLLKLMTQCIILNTEARMEMDDKNHCYIPEGNPVEVGLLNFLTSINVPVQDHFVNRERNWQLLCLIPFSSDRKRMTVAYYSKEQQYVTIVVKGAPEYVIPMCTQQLDHSFDPVEFDGARKQGQYYLQQVISDQMAKGGQKPLTFAYKSMSYEEFAELKSQN